MDLGTIKLTHYPSLAAVDALRRRDYKRRIGGEPLAAVRFFSISGRTTRSGPTGRPQNEIRHSGKPMFAELYSRPERLEQFMDAMAGISAGNFRAFAEKFDFCRKPNQ